MLLRTIMKLVANLPFGYFRRIDAGLRLSLLGRWRKKHQPHPYFKTRKDLYEHVSRIIGNNSPISYLEFGVYEGASIIEWTGLNTCKESEFIGFDSFEGLPEDWAYLRGSSKRGTLSTGGKPPFIEDKRVSFVKGLFQDTLPSFLETFSSDKQIVINCDADLYSSTMYVLCKIDSIIGDGTIVIFDEFYQMLDEFRALDDYASSFLREYEVLGASGKRYYEQVAVRFTK